MPFYLGLIIMLLMCAYRAADANTLSPAIPSTQSILQPMTLTAVEYNQLPISEQQTFAQMWHLNPQDYRHYLWLMENTPNGWYYKEQHLDPSWILGFNAITDQERQKYALIAIENERAKVEKELAFQHEFELLQKELFPNQLPIAKDKTPMNSSR